jgi:hypothetical protein
LKVIFILIPKIKAPDMEYIDPSLLEEENGLVEDGDYDNEYEGELLPHLLFNLFRLLILVCGVFYSFDFSVFFILHFIQTHMNINE